MAIVNFKYYMHDDYSSMERMDWIIEQTGLDLTEDEKEDLNEKIGRPFYEICLDCTLDTETGEVQLIKASL